MSQVVLPVRKIAEELFKWLEEIASYQHHPQNHSNLDVGIALAQQKDSVRLAPPLMICTEADPFVPLIYALILDYHYNIRNEL